MAPQRRERDAAVMVSVRTWLTHDRHHPPVDRLFDAACDLMIATRAFETQSTCTPEDPPTLGVLDASLRTLQASLPNLGARAPACPTNVQTSRELQRAEAALADAAAACDAARKSVLATTRRC